MFTYLNSKKGFTLVEIMIVVAIIGLLAAIAIPNLLRARVNSNESATKGALKTLSSSLESYRSAQSTPQYPTSLATLSGTTPPYIDDTLAGGTKHGYGFAYTRSNTNEFTITATPSSANVTGVNTFFVDETGVIRFTDATGTPVS